MTTARRLVPLGLLLALIALVALTQAPRAVAEGETPAEVAAGQWLFDVRIVKVRGDPGLAEKATPWAEGEGGRPVVGTPWPQLLAALKERGETTILLDQRVTAIPLNPVEVKQSRARHFEIFDRRDQNNEFWKASLLNEGSQAWLLPKPDTLDYEVSVQWSEPVDGRPVPVQSQTRWKGNVLNFPGSTLVLSYREQLELGADATVGVEIWVFVTQRWLPHD